MNTRTNLIAIISVAGALSAVACTAESTDVDTAADTTSDDLNARTPIGLVGTWDAGRLGTLVFSSSNTYLQDLPKFQRGTVPEGLRREFGNVTVNDNKQTFTLKPAFPSVGANAVAYSYQ
jgi:hypothetical protein